MSEYCSLLPVDVGEDPGVAKWDVLESGLTVWQAVSSPLPLMPTVAPFSWNKCLLVREWWVNRVSRINPSVGCLDVVPSCFWSVSSSKKYPRNSYREVSYKPKYVLPYTPGCFSQRNECLLSHKNLYVDVHSSFICNIRKLEKTQMSFNRWMVKPWFILAAVKRNKLLMQQFG